MLGFQSQKQLSVDDFPFNGSTTINRTNSLHNNPCNDNLVQGGNAFMQSKSGVFLGPFEPVVHSNALSISSYGCQYEQRGLEDKLLIEL